MHCSSKSRRAGGWLIAAGTSARTSASVAQTPGVRWLLLCITTGCHPLSSCSVGQLSWLSVHCMQAMARLACLPWTRAVNNPHSHYPLNFLLSEAKSSKSLHWACHNEQPAEPGGPWDKHQHNTTAGRQLSSHPGDNKLKGWLVPSEHFGLGTIRSVLQNILFPLNVTAQKVLQ